MYLSEYIMMLDRSTFNVLYLFMFCIKRNKIATIFSAFVVLLVYLGRYTLSASCLVAEYYIVFSLTNECSMIHVFFFLLLLYCVRVATSIEIFLTNKKKMSYNVGTEQLI